MGRSQVKYRATHGRGRGTGSSRGCGHAHASATGGRSLGSNAFRYQERDEDEEDNATEAAEALSATASGRRQFFAEEKSYRPATGAAAGTYFQSQTVRQWEAPDDDDGDDGTAFGVLDFNWLAEQLTRVPPAIRYRMDPKDCVDFPFNPVDDDNRHEDEDNALSLAGDKSSAAEPIVKSTPTPPAGSLIKTDEEALDSLLELSVSAASADGGRAGGGFTSSTVAANAAATSTATTSQTQMEEWLDDVLDM